MATLDKVVSDIKNLKIQGAENIAEAGLKAWSSAKDKKTAARKLISARPTEPMLQRVIHIAASGVPVNEILNKLKNDKNKIYKNGAKLIINGMKIFTHCHSSTVVGILKEANKQGKKFEVHNTETRPLFQGRITAAQLAGAGIKVHHYVDSAAMQAMKNADLFLIGADAITQRGIYNKIGTGMFADTANCLGIPVYCCAHSWKFAKNVKVEERGGDEVWKGAPREINIHNPAFELAEKDLIKGIISEHGVLNYSDFLRKRK